MMQTFAKSFFFILMKNDPKNYLYPVGDTHTHRLYKLYVRYECVCVCVREFLYVMKKSHYTR